MDEEEKRRLRADILADVGAILGEQLAADAWGRVQVEVVRGPDGEPVVAGIDVEEIVGDEARVDEAFGGEGARAVVPMLAKATEALCALDGVLLEDVRGGTFIHRIDGEGFAWLPGLVRAPSPALDDERDALLAALREKNEALRARFASDAIELDAEARTLRWSLAGRVTATAQATLLGTYSRAPRTWAWAWSHPGLPDEMKRASSALTDAIPTRGIWEISTPVFATDEATAWTIAALVCDRAKGDGVQRLAQEDGAVFVLVRDVVVT
jgi:hypothetical protein